MAGGTETGGIAYYSNEFGGDKSLSLPIELRMPRSSVTILATEGPLLHSADSCHWIVAFHVQVDDQEDSSQEFLQLPRQLVCVAE